MESTGVRKEEALGVGGDKTSIITVMETQQTIDRSSSSLVKSNREDGTTTDGYQRLSKQRTDKSATR